VPAHELFSSTEILGTMEMEKMLGGLSARRYPAGPKLVGERTASCANDRKTQLWQADLCRGTLDRRARAPPLLDP
jgi:hypothetical protein